MRTHSRQDRQHTTLSRLAWVVVVSLVSMCCLPLVHLSAAACEDDAACAIEAGSPDSTADASASVEHHRHHHHDSDSCATCHDLMLAKHVVQKFAVVLVEVGSVPPWAPLSPVRPALADVAVMIDAPPRGPPRG